MSLGEVNEYYAISPDFPSGPLSFAVAESEKDEKTLCDSSPSERIQAMATAMAQKELEEPKVEKDTAKVGQLYSVGAPSDEEEPPLLIFREKIERPLSVISLGCQDEINGELKDSADKYIGSRSEGNQGTTLVNGVIPSEKTLRDMHADNKAMSNSFNNSHVIHEINSNLSLTSVKDNQSQSRNISTLSESQMFSTQSQSQNICSLSESIESPFLAKNSKKEDISCYKNTVVPSHKKCYPLGDSMQDQTDRLKSNDTLHNIFPEESEMPKVFEEDISILMSPSISSTLKSTTPTSSPTRIYPSFPPRKIQRSSPEKMVPKSSVQSHQSSEHSIWQDVLENDIVHRLRTSSDNSSFTELSLKDFLSMTDKGNQQHPYSPELQSQRSILEDETGDPLHNLFALLFILPVSLIILRSLKLKSLIHL